MEVVGKGPADDGIRWTLIVMLVWDKVDGIVYRMQRSVVLDWHYCRQQPMRLRQLVLVMLRRRRWHHFC